MPDFVSPETAESNPGVLPPPAIIRSKGARIVPGVGAVVGFGCSSGGCEVSVPVGDIGTPRQRGRMAGAFCSRALADSRIDLPEFSANDLVIPGSESTQVILRHAGERGVVGLATAPSPSELGNLPGVIEHITGVPVAVSQDALGATATFTLTENYQLDPARSALFDTRS